MSELVDKDAFLKQERKFYCENCDRRKGVKNGRRCFVYEIGEVPCRACDVDDVLDDLECFETIDAPRWRRVEDGLPEPIHPTDPRYKAYLICDSLGYMHVADYTYSKHFPTCYSFHVNGEEETDVKYWMPIEPPKEG